MVAMAEGCTNDFELVIREVRGLGWLLTEKFNAPADMDLSDKIGAARHDRLPLPADIQDRMRVLVGMRDKLVHDVDYELNRELFLHRYEEVLTSLEELVVAPRARFLYRASSRLPLSVRAALAP